MTQLDLFTPTPERPALTVADIDEWMAVTRGVANPHVASHYPHEWASTQRRRREPSLAGR